MNKTEKRALIMQAVDEYKSTDTDILASDFYSDMKKGYVMTIGCNDLSTIDSMVGDIKTLGVKISECRYLVNFTIKDDADNTDELFNKIKAVIEDFERSRGHVN